jgi:photosystem II stability/assembly factor-like uncharacterized protein
LYDALKLTEPLATLAVAVSPEFARDHLVYAGVSGGLLRSTDGGRAWEVNTFDPPPAMSALAVSPNFGQDGLVWAGAMEDGVYCSQDRGRHWATWNFGLLDLNILCIAASPDFARDETLLVGAESGIYRSTNGGRAWREVEFPADLAPVLSLAFSPGYAEDGVVLAGTEANGLWISSDRGDSWTRLAQDKLDGPVSAVLALTAFPKAHLAVLLSDALWVSRSGGSGWTRRAAFQEGAACLAAPGGLDAACLVGLTSGEVVRIG